MLFFLHMIFVFISLLTRLTLYLSNLNYVYSLYNVVQIKVYDNYKLINTTPQVGFFVSNLYLIISTVKLSNTLISQNSNCCNFFSINFKRIFVEKEISVYR